MVGCTGAELLGLDMPSSALKQTNYIIDLKFLGSFLKYGQIPVEYLVKLLL